MVAEEHREQLLPVLMRYFCSLHVCTDYSPTHCSSPFTGYCMVGCRGREATVPPSPAELAGERSFCDSWEVAVETRWRSLSSSYCCHFSPYWVQVMTMYSRLSLCSVLCPYRDWSCDCGSGSCDLFKETAGLSQPPGPAVQYARVKGRSAPPCAFLPSSQVGVFLQPASPRKGIGELWRGGGRERSFGGCACCPVRL